MYALSCINLSVTIKSLVFHELAYIWFAMTLAMPIALAFKGRTAKPCGSATKKIIGLGQQRKGKKRFRSLTECLGVLMLENWSYPE